MSDTQIAQTEAPAAPPPVADNIAAPIEGAGEEQVIRNSVRELNELKERH